jgi:glycosyltransferase involved in cell wall biosynthesis
MPNNLIIISSEQIYGRNLASSSRILNYAKALAISNVNTYFVSKTHKTIKFNKIKKVNENIYSIDNKSDFNGIKKIISHNSFISTFLFLINLLKFIRKLNGKSTILLYPSVDYTMEIMSILILKKIGKYPVFCEINELRRAGISKIKFQISIKIFLQIINNRIKIFFYKFNEYISKYFDGLIAISTNLERYYNRYNDNIIRIPILADIELYNKSQNNFLFGNQFKIGFSGQINIKKESLDIFLNSIVKLKESYSNLLIDLYGSIDQKDFSKLNNIIKDNNLESVVIFKGIIPQDELIENLNKYNLLIIPRKESLQTIYGFSTKLSDYLLTGVPILASSISDIPLYLKDNENSYLISNIDIDNFANKLYEIIINYEEKNERIINSSYITLKNNFDFRNYSLLIKNFLFKN